MRHCTAKPLRGISACGGKSTSGAVQRMALRDQNLRAHQVDARDDFRDRVLHLDARVHLDEEPFVRVEIEQELHRARVVVTDLRWQSSPPRRTSSSRTCGSSADRRRDLHHLLMTPLHRAIALVQMQHVAVLVAEHLHLDVLGARNIFFQENRRIAKGAAGFVARLVQQVREIGGLRAPRACRVRRRRTPP